MLKWLLSAPLLPCNVCAKTWPAGTRLQASLFPQLGKPAPVPGCCGSRPTDRAGLLRAIGQRTDSAASDCWPRPVIHHCTRHGRRTPHDCSTATASSKPRATACVHAARFQLAGELLLCRRQRGSCARLISSQRWLPFGPISRKSNSARRERPCAPAGRRLRGCGAHRWRMCSQSQPGLAALRNRSATAQCIRRSIGGGGRRRLRRSGSGSGSW